MLALAKQYDEDDFQAYIQQWYDNDGWSDLNAFIDGDYLELAIDHLISAGAIDPNLSKIQQGTIVLKNEAFKITNIHEDGYIETDINR